MSRTHTDDGRRRSSMTHATRGHKCNICGEYAYGNGGSVAHGRGHVRRGEAVELLREFPRPAGNSRFFLRPDDPRIDEWLSRGYERVTS